MTTSPGPPDGLHHTHRGSGPPLLLIHGLGGNWRSWEPILDDLAAEREVVAVDLPGFGDSPPLSGEVSIATLADAVTAFLAEHELTRADAAGTSMGARLVLELARRGSIGAAVALDPGGFWSPREVRVFGASIALSVRLVRLLKPVLPAMLANPLTRTLLLGQLSARPWQVPVGVALNELQGLAAAPSTDAALNALARGPTQAGGPTRGPLVIGWGRRDRVTLPRQAPRAVARFPHAHLHWFESSGHFPHWDAPQETTRLILASTGSTAPAAGRAARARPP